MNHIIIAVALVAILFALAGATGFLKRLITFLFFIYCSILSAWSRAVERRLDRRGRQFCNIAEGEHEGGRLTFLAGSVFTTRFLVVKQGADSAHVVPVTAITDYPLGVCYDDNVAVNDPANVIVFGGNDKTMKVQLSGTVAFLDPLCAAAGGGAQKAISGNSEYVFGKCLAPNGGVAGDVVEFAPVLPFAVF